MQRSTFYNVLILVVSGILFASSLQKQASAQNLTFNNVVPFMTTGGMMGFFDQKDGSIYLYAPDLSECLQIVQLTALGKPLTNIK